MTVNTNGEGKTRTRPTVGQVLRMASIFGGSAHGDDAYGVVDLEWAAGDLRRALEFAAVANGLEWSVDFRDPVKCIHDAAVLQVWAQPRDRAEFEPDRYPANMVTPQPVDESLPRNCPTCGTIEWWAVPNGAARRDEWHAAGHDSHRGESIVRDEIRGQWEREENERDARRVKSTALPKRDADPKPASVEEFWGV